MFAYALAAVEAASSKRWGRSAFQGHADSATILGRIHRYRALDKAGLFGLAKDVARLTADRLDTSLLWQVAPLEKTERRGSLKSLERALMTTVPDEQARDLMKVLFGVYDLRLADAHLPSTRVAEALARTGVAPHATVLKQGRALIKSAGKSLLAIALTLDPTLGEDT